MQGIQSVSPQMVQVSKASDTQKSLNNEQKVIIVEKPDSVEFSKKASSVTESKTGKKWGVGIASLIVPGLGQACNGQWGKGLLYFCGQSALYGLAGLMSLACPPLAAVAVIGAIANNVASIVDAVKNV